MNGEAIGSRIVIRNKYRSDGTVERNKAHIVDQIFSERTGVQVTGVQSLIFCPYRSFELIMHAESSGGTSLDGNTTV